MKLDIYAKWVIKYLDKLTDKLTEEEQSLVRITVAAKLMDREHTRLTGEQAARGPVLEDLG